MKDFRLIKKIFLGSIVASLVIVLIVFLFKQSFPFSKTETVNLDDPGFSEYSRGQYFTNYDLTAPEYNPPDHPICVDTLESAESTYDEYVKKYDSIVRERFVYNINETQKYFEFINQKNDGQDENYIQPMRMHRCDYFSPDAQSFYGSADSGVDGLTFKKLGVFTQADYSDEDIGDLLVYLWLAHGAGATPGSKQEPAKLTFDRSKIILAMEYEKAVYGDWGLPDVFSSVRDSLVFNRADRSVTRNYQILSSKKGPNTGGSVIDLQ